MKSLLFLFAISAAAASAQPAAKSSAQFDSESLNYNVNWPSGLSLGEAQLSAQKTGTGWALSFHLDAGVPGFAVVDRFRSATSQDLCSASFDKDVAHGKRKSKEKITFDSSRNLAIRQTLGGGKGEMPTPSCARDALAYLYHVRTELAQGRIPAAQPVFYGAPYQIRLEYGGTQKVRVNDAMVEADRMVANLKGPASEHTFEMYFARDTARTPVLVKVPLAMGSFSMELVR
jgi:hypothetical protein